eukprot:m.210851 g.210851  ORF g.210851 m.210851 type:complete len:131 (+) comp53967_c0_seq1:414-806(+)
MEYCESGTLDSLISQALATSHVREITTQLLKGLDFLHGQRIVHFDLKPLNILISQNVLKIADFGKALRLDDTPVRANTGTPSYAAPEALRRDSPASCKSDIWSLGCVVLHMLTGSACCIPAYLRFVVNVI